MAPRTRNKQRKERRKWMRKQHRLQQNHQDQDLSRDPISSDNASTTTEDNRSSNVTTQGADNGNHDKEMAVSLASKFGELVLEDNLTKNININEQNTNKEKGGHRQQLHPPDCLCILRKQTQGKNFFPPSLFLTPEMMEHSDRIYCLEIPSGDDSTIRK